jgi:polygalacturonase
MNKRIHSATSRRLLLLSAAAVLVCMAATAGAQMATGDGRGTVAEPTFPAVCTQVQADLTISGGEPSSELNTATDTSALQAALSGCAQGKAVEVVMGSGGQDAMVIAPIYIPVGVTLLVDGGVTLFASRNPADYGGSNCGTASSGSCNPLITLGQSSVGGSSTTYYTATLATTGLMGYGVINGRGYDKTISISGSTVTPGANAWWDLAGAGYGGSTPQLLSIAKTANVSLYKISLLNSPHFHVKNQGQGNSSGGKYVTNFTVWGIKLLTPFTARNTDGVDMTGVYNATIANSVIGDGDDESAISASSSSQNFTYSNLLLPSGHGISVGSSTIGGLTNVLVQGANFSGQSGDGNEVALRLKSYCTSGGNVSLVTYQNVCIQNVVNAIDLNPYYSATTSTTSCPAFGTSNAPITFQNVYIDGPSYATVNLQGLYESSSATVPAYITLNNVYANTSSLDLHAGSSNNFCADNPSLCTNGGTTAPSPAYANVTLNGSYWPQAWGTLTNSTNQVTESGSATVASGYPSSQCANAYPPLMGEVYANVISGATPTNNVNKSASVTIPATFVLNAMVLPTNPEVSYSYSGLGSYTGAPAPTAGVNFYDGSTLVGAGTLGSNGTLASVTITNPSAGTHVYTAQYAGDGNYSATTLGANTVGTETQQVTVTVNAGPAAQLAFSAAPPATLVYSTAPGTVTVAVQDAAGNGTTSTVAVTLTVTGPSSYLQTYTVNAVSGTATFNLSSSLPGVGNYSYVASSGGLTSTGSSPESITAAPLYVAAQAASRVFGDVNPSFTYQITGYRNNDPTSVVSGVPVLTTTALRDSPAATYPITAAVGTLSAANYNFYLYGNTLTVTGGALQSINFAPLPNFTHPGQYQLTASTTSGLPVAYTVSGAASVSGTTLNVSGTGTVTVTASSGSNGNYAAAASVRQQFTAQ